jgi:hypothetical protein
MSVDERPAWRNSTRRERLPVDWPALRAAARERDPQRICHWCGEPGGDELDHKVAGDNHSLDNLAWIHGRRAYAAGRSKKNCHGEKSAAEGAAARPRLHRKPDVHPAFR